jgi:hypothetical protein
VLPTRMFSSFCTLLHWPIALPPPAQFSLVARLPFLRVPMPSHWLPNDAQRDSGDLGPAQRAQLF